MSDKIKFKAKIIRERFYNETNNYGIYVFTTDDDIPYLDTVLTLNHGKNSSVIVGNMQRLAEDIEYDVIAELVVDKKYGKQYKVIRVSKDMPKNLEDSKKYLCALTKNPAAGNLLDKYPDIVNMIKNNTDSNIDLSDVKGIKEASYKKIREKILEYFDMSNLISLLFPLGITMTMIKNIYSKNENTELLEQKIKDNPYWLLDKFPRLTFKKIDEFAINMDSGFARSMSRVYAAAQHIFSENENNDGNTVMKLSDYNTQIKSLIPDAYDLYEKFLKKEKESEISQVIKVIGDMCGSTRTYRIEKYVWDRLCYIQSFDNDYNYDIDKKLEGIVDRIGYNISEEQKEAVKTINNNNVVVISGKAGAGKTTALKAILDIYKDKKIAIVAFSAKAARRSTEVTGFPANTIHRYLGAMGDRAFTYNENKKRDDDIVIIDEMSMVNIHLFYSLLLALPDTCKIVMIGDFRQLPAIGAGALFTDIINLDNPFTKIELTQVFRQAADSGIITDANMIREGKQPFKEFKSQMTRGVKQDMSYIFKESSENLRQSIVQIYTNALKNGYTTDTVQIIVPRRDNCVLSTSNLNNDILNILIPNNGTNTIEFGKKIFRKGCKVINTVNNYQKENNSGEDGVLNGETGYIIDILKNDDNFSVIVDFGNKISEFKSEEINNLELAYALTVHKLQGSEVKLAIVGIETGHYVMLNRQLLYTAITRAKEKCVILAQQKAFSAACHKSAETNRTTFWQLGIFR